MTKLPRLSLGMNELESFYSRDKIQKKRNVMNQPSSDEPAVLRCEFLLGGAHIFPVDQPQSNFVSEGADGGTGRIPSLQHQ